MTDLYDDKVSFKICALDLCTIVVYQITSFYSNMGDVLFYIIPTLLNQWLPRMMEMKDELVHETNSLNTLDETKSK